MRLKPIWIKKMIAGLLSIVCSFAVLSAAYAAPITADFTNTYYRILFLVDCSGSMSTQDPNRLVMETIKMFVDATDSTKTDIGFEAYNDAIVNNYPLTSMADSGARQDIKSAVDEIQWGGNTDIGFALKYGMEMFQNNPKPNTKSLVVMFSDGETDLTYTKTGRTDADSTADETAAFAISKQIGCPIYTVGMSQDGNLNTDYLSKIATETGGKNYELRSSNALPSIFSAMLSDVTGRDISSQNNAILTNGSQSISIPVPGDYSSEVNIILQYDANTVSNLACAQNGAIIYSSKYYTSVKIPNPSGNEVDLSFIGQAGNAMKINTVCYTDVLPKLETPTDLSAREVPITVELVKPDGSAVTADSGLTAELTVSGDKSETLPMQNTGDGFTATYNNDAPANVDFSVNVIGQGYEAESDSISESFTNNAPVTKGDFNKTLLNNSKGTTYDLSDYFSDPDGDPLSFAVSGNDDKIADAAINNGQLTITPQADGSANIAVTASDGRGGQVVGTFVIQSIPWWVYYKDDLVKIGIIFLILLVVFLLIMLIFAHRRKKTEPEKAAPEYIPNTRFMGAKFEGYFLNTLSGNEIPILNWNASYIDNKYKTSLGELFRILEVTENLPEAEKIYFEAGNNNTVIFHHDTSCIVSLGKTDIQKGKKVVLNFDDKLYITFEDNVTEIEVRYKRARKISYVN